jgi:hypothetical protein
MKVTGLDNRIYTWKLTSKMPLEDDSIDRSDLHLKARELLHILHPLDRILEEVPLPGSYGLAVDFYLPFYKLIIEVQGEQHYKYIPYFHGDILGFWSSKKRDRNKRKWAELNNLLLVELPYNESIEQWTDRIRTRKNAECS